MSEIKYKKIHIKWWGKGESLNENKEKRISGQGGGENSSNPCAGFEEG